MSNIIHSTSDQLAGALQLLGVNFLLGGTNNDESLPKQPARLIAELAESKEACLRLSIIPIFLKHPEFTFLVRMVTQDLGRNARLALQCYYTAAGFLQQKYFALLRILIGGKPSLPEFFSHELGVQSTSDSEENLRILAQRHQILSNAQVNWLGTYQYAAQIWIKGLELNDS